MDTIIYPFETANTDTVPVRQIEPAPSGTITTTLYDLVATIQSAMEPGEEELVVPMVAHILRTGRAALPFSAQAQVA